MLKIADAVYDIIIASPTALEALRLGILNFSAYAEQILPEVEQKTWKKVKKNSIVVALSRYAEDLRTVPPLIPQVRLDELSIKTPLSDLTYEKTATTLNQVSTLLQQAESSTHILTITQGIDEITLVVAEEYAAAVREHFSAQPKSVFSNLVGVNVRFSESYLAQANVIYAIISVLAQKRVNLIEIVSTYTELTVIIEKKDLELTVAQLQTLFT